MLEYGGREFYISPMCSPKIQLELSPKSAHSHRYGGFSLQLEVQKVKPENSMPPNLVGLTDFTAHVRSVIAAV